MKVVTWNVNSIQSRLPRVLDFLEREEPDILCLQEIKCLDEMFPYSEIEALGYQCAVSGQKTYNGVALISRHKLSQVAKSIGAPQFDEEARLISARFKQTSIVNIYVPNGQSVDSDKYHYKLQWLDRLEVFLKNLLETEKQVIVCGDFNIAPEDIDVCDPHSWKESVLVSPTERKKYQKLLALGLTDFFREKRKDQQTFSWWDYRKSAFSRNQGLRIDLILGTRSVLNELEDIYIDVNERKGVQPSDHAPVVSVFKNRLAN